MNENNRRVNVTSSKHAIAGYQKGKCFYCYGSINIDQEYGEVCHVDHFFPDMLKQFNFNNIDLIWNLFWRVVIAIMVKVENLHVCLIKNILMNYTKEIIIL